MAANEGLPASTGSNLEYYQCSQCRRSYSRVDHLARHVRSHLQQKPFECPVCNKGFGRPDVLKRHALSHEPDASDPKRQRRHVGHSSRVAQACKACAAAKLKCEDEKPCRRCRLRNTVCEYGADVRYVANCQQGQHHRTVTSQPPHPVASFQHDAANIPQSHAQSHQLPTPDTDTQETSETLMRPDESAGHSAVLSDGEFSDFLRDVVMMPQIQPIVNPPSTVNWGVQQDFWPRDVLNFTVDSNLDLQSVDFGMLHALNGVRDPASFPEHVVDPDDAETTRNYAALGTDAFKNSPVSRWRPNSDDSMYIDQEDLALPEGMHARLRVDQILLSEHLGLRARDAILALVLANCKPSNVPRVVASFPTAGLLDDFMQRFFLQHRSQIGSWIHIPSFKPSVERLELLCGLVAAGAILTGIQALRKFGFALHEALRLAIPRRCELENSVTRQLWLLQSLMLDLDIGLWSGNQRKMELSESQQQILITMMRRGGKFQRSRAPAVVPLPNDTGEVLNEKWYKWIEQESLKRVVFHAYLHNSQISLSLHVNPIISYTELSLHLPEAHDLWDAETAEGWKAIYLSKAPRPPDRTLSVLDAIREPTMLVCIQRFCDLQYSALIALHGTWGMIWDYTQMNSVIKNRADSNASLIMKSSHQEMCQALIRFRMSMAEWMVDPSPEVLLIFDLLLMYLHMSLEDIQLFAGKEGRTEARRVFPLLQEWIVSPNCREAIWHAAQVLRRARSFASNSLRDFYAVAVYHASIAFWAFGVISKVKPLVKPDALPGVAELAGSHPYVLLDGETTADVERFVGLGRGVPSISIGASHNTTPACVSLTEPEAAMDVMIETLKQNFTGVVEEYALPPMVENLVKLMRDLGKAARNVGR